MAEAVSIQRSGRKRKFTRHEVSLPAELSDFVGEFPELKVNGHGQIDGGGEIVFLELDFDIDAQVPEELPSIVSEGKKKIYILLPSDNDLADRFGDRMEPVLDVERLGEAPLCNDSETAEWPSSEEIGDAVGRVRSEVFDLKSLRKADEVLENALSSHSTLFAGREPIELETPMLIEGFMSRGGVSVVYGGFDEFKTTVVMDMMMHVAMGVPWHGRTVYPRPVFWFALERADEARLRVRALQERLIKKDPAWGAFVAPITVFERIPDNDLDWRAEIMTTWSEISNVRQARETRNELPIEMPSERVRYPEICDVPPVVVVDTLSQWLGGEDEKGPKAVKRISEALDLLKMRPELREPWDKHDREAWLERNPTGVEGMDYPVASQVVIIHHTTKTGDEFAGHRAIAADTQALYRVKRSGRLGEKARSMVGVITPIRTKDIQKPEPIRFETEIVTLEGTCRSTAILKEKAVELPKSFDPIMKALRNYGDQAELENDDVNDCIDTVADNRTTRGRYRKKLVDCGILEPVEDDSGKIVCYLFNDLV